MRRNAVRDVLESAGIAPHPVSRHHEPCQRMLEAGRNMEGLSVIHGTRECHKHRVHERGDFADGIVARTGRPLRRDARAALCDAVFAYGLAVVTNDGVDRGPGVITLVI
jgi:hypothetical protein